MQPFRFCIYGFQLKVGTSIFLGLALLTMISSSVLADEPSYYSIEDECCALESSPPIAELKVGYFLFADTKMRKIYNKGGIDVQLSGSYPIWRWLHLYGSVEYLDKQGNSLGADQETSIQEVPVSIGLKPVFTICPSIQYYIAAGPQYFFLYANNKSPYVNKNIYQNGVGAFINTGFNIYVSNHFFIDIVGEYTYRQMHFHSSKTNVYGQKAQVGGLSLCVALGYSF